MEETMAFTVVVTVDVLDTAWPMGTVPIADELREVKVVHSEEEVLSTSEVSRFAAAAAVDVFDATCPIETMLMADEKIEVKVVHSTEVSMLVMDVRFSKMKVLSTVGV